MNMAAFAKRIIYPSLLLAGLLTLSACGGDSGSSSSKTVITTIGAVISPVASVATPDGAPGNCITYPIGWLSYTITNVPIGGTIEVNFAFPAGTNPTGYIKYENGNFTTLSGSEVSVSGNSMILRLTDGGPLDADGEANGVIVDPGAPFISSDNCSTSSSGSSDSSSSS